MSSNTHADSEKLLYKLILQFAIYNRGSNSHLDPVLNQISHSLKNGATLQQLTPELISLSKTLAHLSNAENTQPNNIQEHPEEVNKYFITSFLNLLRGIGAPPRFHNQCILLQRKGKLALTNNSYKSFVDSVVSLLIKINDSALYEKRSLEVFLAEIPNLLTSLKEKSLEASTSNKESIDNRGKLSFHIDLQVNNIKNSSEKATELSSLKNTISFHLQELSSHLLQHNDSEDTRQFEIQKQLDKMSSQLEEMEVETEMLRNNLLVAHDKALTDSLTSLPNRAAFDERLSLEYKRWHRYKNSLTLVIWDIDFFKKINDKFGHKAGDKTLSLVAQLISNNARETDFIARYGGEEFVMILPNTSSKEALILTEKTRNIIAKSGFNHHGNSIKLTISCGISQLSDGDTHESFFERADKALYLSKEQGRNRCSIIEKTPDI